MSVESFDWPVGDWVWPPDEPKSHYIKPSQTHFYRCQVCGCNSLLERIKSLESELEPAKADCNAEGVRLRAEYLPKLKALERDISIFKAIVADDNENESALRKEALKVLPAIEVEGDSYGVPSIADIGDKLVARVKALEENRDHWRKEYKTLELAGDILVKQRDQAHDAIKLAGEALEHCDDVASAERSGGMPREKLKQALAAIAQIRARGIEGE